MKLITIFLFMAAIYIISFYGCSAEEEVNHISAIFTQVNLSPGDTVGHFIVTDSVYISEDTTDWAGIIHFSGETEISGTFGNHPVQPDLQTVSFFPDRNTVHLLPRYIKDERNGWLTFNNEDDDPLIVTLRNHNSGTARIIISDFIYIYDRSGAENRARLLEIVEFE
jgi:hypothetical protein